MLRFLPSAGQLGIQTFTSASVQKVNKRPCMSEKFFSSKLKHVATAEGASQQVRTIFYK